MTHAQNPSTAQPDDTSRMQDGGYMDTHMTPLPSGNDEGTERTEKTEPRQLKRHVLLLVGALVLGGLLTRVALQEDASTATSSQERSTLQTNSFPNTKSVNDAVNLAQKDLQEQAKLEAERTRAYELERARLARQQQDLEMIEQKTGVDLTQQGGLAALDEHTQLGTEAQEDPNDPWVQARAKHRQTQAQNYYQNLHAARGANLFFNSGSYTRGTTPKHKGMASPQDQDAQTAAFLAKIDAIQSNPNARRQTMPSSSPQAMHIVRTRKDRQEDFFVDAPHAPHRTGAPGAGPVQVEAGTIIHVALETGINSDLPGIILARTSQPVYDPSMTTITVPAGTRVMGTYNARTSRGDERVQVAWTAMILPDGQHLKLGNFPGVDLAGMSGVEGKVDEHWDGVLAGTAIGTVFSAASAAAQGPQNQLNVSPRQSALQGAANNVNGVGQKIAERYLEVEPTITLEPGHVVGILVTRDMTF